MNIKTLKETIEGFKNELNGALLSCDIWEKKTGLSIAGYNTNDKYTALFGKLTDSMEDILENLNFPSFGEYQIIDLETDKILVILNFEKNYIWGSLVDKSKISLGYLINVAIPHAQKSFIDGLHN